VENPPVLRIELGLRELIHILMEVFEDPEKTRR
jgi:hypothetical protein